MFLSKFTSKLKIYNNYVVFNNLLFKPIVLSEEKINSLYDGKFDCFNDKEIRLLTENGIIVSNKVQDENALKTLKDRVANICNKHVSILYIIPVMGCNLCCKYCFIGKIKNNTTEAMSDETIKNTIEKFSEHLKKNNLNGNIIFYGGEPTLRLDILKKFCDYINVYGNGIISISIVTNCTLVNDELIQFLKNNKISIGISIDGPKELTDKNRIFKNSKESVYDIVINNIKKLTDNNINFGLSIVVSNETLNDKNYLNWLKK